VYPPDPELLVEFVLWIWWCVILGLSVNLGVQLLLSPGDPLMLLRRELDTRLQTVAQLLRRLATNDAAETAATASVNSPPPAAIPRPLPLQKPPPLTPSGARPRHEK